MSKFLLLAYKNNRNETHIKEILNFSLSRLLGNNEKVNATAFIEEFYGQDSYNLFLQSAENINNGKTIIKNMKDTFYNMFIDNNNNNADGISSFDIVKSIKSVFTVTTLKSIEFETATNMDQDYQDILYQLQRIPASAKHLEEGFYASLFTYINLLLVFLGICGLIKIACILYKKLNIKKYFYKYFFLMIVILTKMPI